jgi:regulator of PEP synthase PpsR (kinase-PPPase family)
MSDQPRNTIHVVSDATGNTAEQMVRAALVQFSTVNPKLRIWPRVRTIEELDTILEQATGRDALIVHTLVNPLLSEHLYQSSRELHIRCLDLIGPLLATFSDFFEAEPLRMPGHKRRLDDSYFRRVEAIEFTVNADDGRGLSRLSRADLILAGVSRTSKTPVATFLAGKGFKVANVPLIRNVEPPAALDDMPSGKVYGLTIDPEKLVEIRANRVQRLNLEGTGDYAAINSVEAEVRWAEEIFERNDWPVIDVTDLAIEEIASEILKLRQIESAST